MEFEQDHQSPSFGRRFRRSVSVSRWFSSSDASSTSGSDDDNSSDSPTIASRSLPSAWIKDLASMFPKIGGGKRRNRRRAGGASVFRYDPASYALNFEDESPPVDDFAPASFSARLAAL